MPFLDETDFGGDGPDDERPREEERMNPHFYHLKKLCRKKGAPLFPYKIDVRDFKDEETWKVL